MNTVRIEETLRNGTAGVAARHKGGKLVAAHKGRFARASGLTETPEEQSLPARSASRWTKS